MAHENNNTVKGGKAFNGNTSDDFDFFEKQYKLSLYNRITTLLSAFWSYISCGNKEFDMKTTPKRFPGAAAEGLGMSWYTFPVYWLYKFCVCIHLYDVWLLSLFHTPHNSSRTQLKQSRLNSLALFLLFLPFIVLAGYGLSSAWNSVVWCIPSWQITEFLTSPVYTVFSVIRYFANILLNLLSMLGDSFTFLPSILSSSIATMTNFSKILPTTDAESTEYQKNMFRETTKANILNEILQSEKMASIINAILISNNSNDDVRLFIQQTMSKNSHQHEILKIKELDEKIMVMEKKLNSAYAKLDQLLQHLTDFKKAVAARIDVTLGDLVTEQHISEKLSYYENQILQKSDEEYKKIYGRVVNEVVDLIKMEIKERYSDLQSVQRNLSAHMNVSDWESIKSYVNSTVEKMLAIYDADKTNTVDYAMGSSGGSVVSTRCTEPYTETYASYQLFGFLNWHSQPVSPSIVIQPGIQPGLCWAFVGSRGNLVFELSQNITVTGFTMEHIPSSISTSGNIDSAPYVFHVLGLTSENDENSTFLGRFTYEDNGVSLQRYDAKHVNRSFKMVELVIESNHGSSKYTCLYRFRVHGIPMRH